MADLIEMVDAARVRANLVAAREEIAAAASSAGRDGAEVEIVAAGKYVALEAIGALAAGGVTVIGENRAQDLEAKVAAHGDLVQWDFIGALQSRKVRLVLPRVRVLHSLASGSALEQIARHAERARPGIEVLLEVNVSGEEGKAGIAPAEIPRYLDRCALPVTGLMTMPPHAERPEDSRPWFAALRELAEHHGLARLSMGTTQDFAVAVEEGATIVRIGTRLLA